MALRTTLLLACASLCACGSPPDSESTATGDDAIRVCAPGPTVEGIDVSTYEGNVSWGEVAGAGVAFAFARVSDGLGNPDDQFDRNWSTMAKVGLVRGVYQFFRASEDPIAQADLLLSKIGTLGPNDLPPVLDLELSDGQSSATIVSAAGAWLDRVQAATGKVPIVYTAEGFWDTLSGTSAFARYPLWVANYGASCPTMPGTWGRWAFWQYSESGSVAGVAGGVDRSVFNGTAAQLRALASAGSAPAEALSLAWTRAADGRYTFRATGPADVAKVELTVDAYAIGGAAVVSGAAVVDYAFSEEGAGRRLEAKGYDASGKYVAHGVAALDVTAGTAVFVRETGARTYEIGLERPPVAVAAIEARVDGVLLRDGVTGATRSSRLGVTSSLTNGGARTFVVTTYDASGTARGSLTRSLTID